MKKVIVKGPLKAVVFAVVLMLPMLVSGCGNSKTPEYVLSGNWYVYQTASGAGGAESVQSVALLMSASDNSFTLTPSLSGYTSGGGSEDSSGNINFSWTDANSNSFTFTGSLTGPSTMSGAWTSSNGKSGFWNGLNQIAASGINFGGQWAATYSGSDVSSLPSAFTLTQQSDNCTITGTNGISGNINDAGGTGHIIFYLTGGNNAVYVFTGTLNGSSMSGDWSNSNSESGSWSATHS